MIYTAMTKKALRLCYDAHAGQMDKGGVPYVFHPYHLAEQMPDEVTTIVALLHDVVEDAGMSLEALKDMGFGKEILDALDLLTHRKGTCYMAYITAIRDNPIAKTVKLADLRHNSDLSRLDLVTDDDRRRVEKYRRAQEFLASDTTTRCDQ